MVAKKNPTDQATIPVIAEMDDSSDSNLSIAAAASLSVPLLGAKTTTTSSSLSSFRDAADPSKSVKLAEQIKVNRLLSFLSGSVVGVFMQLVSVLIFTRMIMHRGVPTVFDEPSHHGGNSGYDDIMMVSTQAQDVATVIDHFTTVSGGGGSDGHPDTPDHFHHIFHGITVFHILVWIVYHLSLAVYLVVWFAMMTLAISKVGWRCISTSLSLRSTRRTCFLKTFFFINGFVQGSLMPWIFLELYIGNPSFDVYWMPTTHLAVFFAVVYIYDWMADSSPPKSQSSSSSSSSEEHPDHDDYYDIVIDDDDDDDDDGTNFLV